MVSLDRARECIGRRIKHVTNIEVFGTVERVGEYDVWVRIKGDDVVACDPDNMEWVSTLPDFIREGVEEYEDRTEDGQLRLAWDVQHPGDDDDAWFEELHVVYSPAAANDDGNNHPLYIIVEAMRKVYLGRPTALPDGAWEIEELLGWAQP